VAAVCMAWAFLPTLCRWPHGWLWYRNQGVLVWDHCQGEEAILGRHGCLRRSLWGSLLSHLPTQGDLRGPTMAPQNNCITTILAKQTTFLMEKAGGGRVGEATLQGKSPKTGVGTRCSTCRETEGHFTLSKCHSGTDKLCSHHSYNKHTAFKIKSSPPPRSCRIW
jgi:hypothetical protein